MKTLILNVPESLELTSFDLNMMVASHLYEQGKLSLGQAAEMVGLSKKTFMELLSKFKVSVFNFPSTELASDVRNA